MNAAAALNFSADPDAPTRATAWAYRRQARRLRWQFRDDPAALHCSLKLLSASEDARRPWKSTRRLDRPVQRVAVRVPDAANGEAAGDAASPIAPGVAAALHTSTESANRFAGLVSAMLSDEGILRYSRRQALLRQAAKLDIGAFEANLIIAAVEHRRTSGTSRAAARPSRSTQQRWPVAWIVGALLAIESIGISTLVAWMG
jgi:hypothetical protein